LKLVSRALFALCLFAAPARAVDLDQPKFAEGDVWLYGTVHKTQNEANERDFEYSFIRVQGDRMVVAAKEVGATKPPMERLTPLDWSRTRSVNGVETTVSRPFAFPLAAGKSWRVEFTEANPTQQMASIHYEVTYKVVGPETVKTTAGEYKAIKIEGNGTWTGEIAARVFNNSAITKLAPNSAITSSGQNVIAGKRLTGRIYRLYFYAPEVKRWVKLLEESYGPNGETTDSYAETLKDFHPG